MKLSFANEMRLEEARMFVESLPLLENGEGPRWGFKYDNFNVDPTPDILLLGAYRHPNTGNNLVGGINLHYLNPAQVNKLARALPKIMNAGNLKARYWKGRELLPDVFTDYYRTYDSKYIRGVKQDVMYPKYGFVKATKDWLKKKAKKLFQTKKQKEKEDEPKYPDDLQQMQARLDDIVTNLQKSASPEIQNTPEMQRAREAFQKFQIDKARREFGATTGTTDKIVKKSMDDYVDNELSGTSAPQAGINTYQELTPKERAEEFEQEREQNKQELLDPNNELDPNMDLEESIIYFSPVKKRYIIEKFAI